MHLDHKAGDKLYVDFAGERLWLTDKESGEQTQVEVFVAILRASQLTYVEAVMSQQKEDFIAACENTLHYIGGVPVAIVPDNLKAAVTKSNRYEPILNEAFTDFADHYGTAVLPARAYRPRDTALVEGPVKIVYSYSTDREHLATTHRFMTDWTPDRFLEWAVSIHEDVRLYILKVLDRKQHPEQAYRSCVGILGFAKKTSHERLASACRRALGYGIYNYKTIQLILENNMDRYSENLFSEELPKPRHDNIRGEDYYRQPLKAVST